MSLISILSSLFLVFYLRMGRLHMSLSYVLTGPSPNGKMWRDIFYDGKFTKSFPQAPLTQRALSEMVGLAQWGFPSWGYEGKLVGAFCQEGNWLVPAQLCWSRDWDPTTLYKPRPGCLQALPILPVMAGKLLLWLCLYEPCMPEPCMPTVKCSII